MVKPALFDILYLLTIPNIGPGRIRRMFQVFENLNQIKRAPVQHLVRIEGIDLKVAKLIKSEGDREFAERQLNLIEKYKIDYLTIWDEGYPEILKQIPDPPVIMFYKGSLDKITNHTIAVVGTRNASSYGKTTTMEIVQELVTYGITIVSGMARGIDALAHQKAIQCDGKTIAVLGTGLDVCYPRENRSLFDSIPNHGCVVSEFPLGAGPDAPNFPRRNRIISGLSLGTLVVEAGARSGAIITALYALHQNREVFAIPGNINHPKSQGCNRLIQQGAKLVLSVDDILEEIGLPYKKVVSPVKSVPDDLGPSERNLLKVLSRDPKHIDQIVMELHESPSNVLSGLLTLELRGLVEQSAGKMFVRL